MVGLEELTGDVSQLRQAYGCFPSGVTAVCAQTAEGLPVGMAASSFTSVSMDPPLVSICVQDTSTTWPVLRRMSRLGVSVLGAGQDAAARSLAARNADRFAGLDWEPTSDGGVLVRGASAWLDCTVHEEVPAGDHVIVLLRIHALAAWPDSTPLVFHGSRFRRLEVA